VDALLIVEDQAELRRLVMRQLLGLNLEILEAGDGIEALQILQDHGPRVRAALVDWTLPVLGGAELVRRMGQEHASLPILLCSAHPLTPAQCRGDNVKGFMLKPYLRATLREHLAELWPPFVQTATPLPQAIVSHRPSAPTTDAAHTAGPAAMPAPEVEEDP